MKKLFLGKELASGLRVRISAKEWANEYPSITVFDGHCPVLTAYVYEGAVSGWITRWSIFGNEPFADIGTEEIAELMGWQMIGAAA